MAEQEKYTIPQMVSMDGVIRIFSKNRLVFDIANIGCDDPNIGFPKGSNAVVLICNDERMIEPVLEAIAKFFKEFE